MNWTYYCDMCKSVATLGASRVNAETVFIQKGWTFKISPSGIRYPRCHKCSLLSNRGKKVKCQQKG